MRVVFCGTPDFALPSLRALVEADFEVALVVSQPDKVRGRGRRATPTPIRALARQLDLPEITLERGQRKSTYARILDLRPDVVVVVAFGHIVREPLLHGPRLGCVNVHASLLPRWRGPAPIHRAVVAGDRETGVCTMALAEGVDTGDLFLSQSTSIGEDETTGALHDRLAALGGELLVPTLLGLDDGSVAGKPQDDEAATYAPMLKKDEGSVEFDAPATRVHDRIRGLDPWPAVTVLHDERRLKLGDSRRLETAADATPGTVLAIDEAGMVVACADAAVRVGRVQPEGRKAMTPADFARGSTLREGCRLRALPDYRIDPS